VRQPQGRAVVAGNVAGYLFEFLDDGVRLDVHPTLDIPISFRRVEVGVFLYDADTIGVYVRLTSSPDLGLIELITPVDELLEGNTSVVVAGLLYDAVVEAIDLEDALPAAPPAGYASRHRFDLVTRLWTQA